MKRPTGPARVLLISAGLCGAAGATQGLEFVRLLGDPAFKHAESLTHIEQLPDGRLLSSAEDGSARVWDLGSGEQVHLFSHGDDDVWNAIALPGGGHVATAGDVVRIWELAGGEMLRELRHEDDAFRLAAVPGGKLLASGHDDSVILIRNWETGELVRQLEYAKDEVFTLVAPSADRLIAGGDGGLLQMWDLGTGESLEKIELENKSRLTTISLSPNRERITVNSGDKLLCFDCADLEKRWEVELGDSAAISHWSPDGRFVVTCADDELLKINSRSGKVIWRKALPFDDHRAVAFSTDGQQIFTGGDWMIYRFAASDGEQLHPPPDTPHLRGGVSGIALAGDSGIAFAGGGDRQIHRFDTTGRRRDPLAPWKVTIEIDKVAIDLGGESLSVMDRSGDVQTLSAEDGRALARFETGDSYAGLAAGAGGVLLTRTSDSITRWQDGERIGSLTAADGGSFETFGVSRDGAFVAASIDEGGALVWDTATGGRRQAISGQIDSADVLGLFPDAGALAVAADEKLYTWSRPASDRLVGRDAEIGRHVASLASEVFAEREAAKRELLALGTAVLPNLEDLRSDDPEVRLQLAQVMRVLREKLSGALEESLAFDKDVVGFDVHPDGVHWVAVTGRGHATKLHLGRRGPKSGTFEVIASVDSPHSAHHARFSGDGKWLVTGNRTATLSVYRFTGSP